MTSRKRREAGGLAGLYAVVCALAAAVVLVGWQPPMVKPITKRGLVDALKIGGLTTPELIRKVKERGVDFRVTPAVEDELRQAGAAPEVIQAVRENYREGAGRHSKPIKATHVMRRDSGEVFPR